MRENLKMPELPEVETVRRGIEPHILGQTITRLRLSKHKLRRPFPANMAENIEGARVKRVARRGKYLLIGLSHHQTLIIHLGMSGRIQISQKAQGNFYYDSRLLPQHSHAIFEFSGGIKMVYNDPRRFGIIDLASDERLWQRPYLKILGPEPLSNAFTAPFLRQQLTRCKMPIKSALLNQHFVAGIGNIYANEAIFGAKIAPLCRADKLAVHQSENLVDALRRTLEKAIEAGGSSLRDHRQSDGTLGYFQHQFAVYAREGEPCQSADCSATILKITQSGRATYYCPSCQGL